MEQFGYDRPFLVLANTVRQKEWDGHISHSNKEWAKSLPVPEDKDSFGRERNREFIVGRSHTGPMDLFLTQTRREYQKFQEQIVTYTKTRAVQVEYRKVGYSKTSGRNMRQISFCIKQRSNAQSSPQVAIFGGGGITNKHSRGFFDDGKSSGIGKLT